MRKTAVFTAMLMLIMLLLPVYGSLAAAAGETPEASGQQSAQRDRADKQGFEWWKPVVIGFMQMMADKDDRNGDKPEKHDRSHKPGNKPDKPGKPDGKPDNPGKPDGKPDKPGKPDNPDKPDKPDKPGGKPDKPDEAEKDRIIAETTKQLVALKNVCEPQLVSIALQFSMAESTHEKTVLYDQGTTVFAGCVSDFKDIMQEASAELEAAGFSPSELDPFQGRYEDELRKGKQIAEAILKS